MSTSTAPRIRAARPDDWPVLAEFNQRLAQESEGRGLDPAVIARGVQRALAQPEACRYFVAELDGRIVGQTMVTCEWSDWRCGWFWWIQSVYVAAEHRGRGVYRALHQHIEALARAAGDVCGLRLYVETANQRAIATYENLGMSRTHYLLYERDWSGTVRE